MLTPNNFDAHGAGLLRLDQTTLQEHQRQLEQAALAQSPVPDQAQIQAEEFIRTAKIESRVNSKGKKSSGIFMAPWMIKLLEEDDEIRYKEMMELPAIIAERKRRQREIQANDPAQVQRQAKQAQQIQDKRSRGMRNNQASRRGQQPSADHDGGDYPLLSAGSANHQVSVDSSWGTPARRWSTYQEHFPDLSMAYQKA